MLSLKQAAQHHADQAHWYPQCRVVVSLAGRPFRCAPVMTNVELVEVISFVLEDMMAGRPTMAPGRYPERPRRKAHAGVETGHG
jgi:hypothetical protein